MLFVAFIYVKVHEKTLKMVETNCIIIFEREINERR